MTSHGQCPRGGGCACECPRVGVFSNFLRSDDVTCPMSKGGGVLVKNPVSAPGGPGIIGKPKPDDFKIPSIGGRDNIPFPYWGNGIIIVYMKSDNNRIPSRYGGWDNNNYGGMG